MEQIAEAGKIRIPHDENGNPAGYTVDEVFAEADKDLSEYYGVDFDCFA
jgi:hypothetical protein